MLFQGFARAVLRRSRLSRVCEVFPRPHATRLFIDASLTRPASSGSEHWRRGESTEQCPQAVAETHCEGLAAAPSGRERAVAPHFPTRPAECSCLRPRPWACRGRQDPRNSLVGKLTALYGFWTIGRGRPEPGAQHPAAERRALRLRSGPTAIHERPARFGEASRLECVVLCRI